MPQRRKRNVRRTRTRRGGGYSAPVSVVHELFQTTGSKAIAAPATVKLGPLKPTRIRCEVSSSKPATFQIAVALDSKMLHTSRNFTVNATVQRINLQVPRNIEKSLGEWTVGIKAADEVLVNGVITWHYVSSTVELQFDDWFYFARNVEPEWPDVCKGQLTTSIDSETTLACSDPIDLNEMTENFALTSL